MSEEMKNLNEQPEETVVENTEPQVEETPVEEPKVEEELHFPNTEPDLDELNRQMKIEEIVDAKD